MSAQTVYLLTLNEDAENCMEAFHDYNRKVVVRAKSSTAARKLCDERLYGDEQRVLERPWKRPDLSKCRALCSVNESQGKTEILCIEDHSHG